MTKAVFKERLEATGFSLEAAALSASDVRDSPLMAARMALAKAARAICPTADVVVACDQIEKSADAPVTDALLSAILSADGKPGCPARVRVVEMDEDGRLVTTDRLPLSGLASAAAWATKSHGDDRDYAHAAACLACLGRQAVIDGINEINQARPSLVDALLEEPADKE